MDNKFKSLGFSILLMSFSIILLLLADLFKLPNRIHWKAEVSEGDIPGGYEVLDFGTNTKYTKGQSNNNWKFGEPDKPPCSNVSRKLMGQRPIRYEDLQHIPYNIEKKVKHGGYYEPEHCLPEVYTAIIIPYRDRMLHLFRFLHHYHPLLQRQNIAYRIFSVSQMDDESFNRGMLMNVGYVEAKKYMDWDCYVFHDVDHYLENDELIYRCNSTPTLFSTSIEKFDYKIPYATFFGGVTALTEEQMEKMNGYPNAYWGWGGEDDDASNRVRGSGYTIYQMPSRLGRYGTHKHPQAKQSEEARNLLNTWSSRWQKDGLLSLNYRLLGANEYALYTQFDVHLVKNTLKS